MANKHLLRKPTYLDSFTWYYETPKGIEIYHQCTKPNSEKVGGVQLFTIPWRKFRAALKRKDRKL
jgi:hypothetical protein